ncbi:MAG TPA: penicillin-binding protein 2 [Actinomycetota bacterium]
MNRPPLGRLGTLFVVLILGFAAITVRLAFLQVRDADALTALALQQRLRTLEPPADRGAILDRNGRELAMSLDAAAIYADPSLITHPSTVGRRLAPLLHERAADITSEIQDSASPRFAYLARQVDTDVADRVRKLGITGIGFLPDTKRYYPNGATAPQVLGVVGVDGTGESGLEYEYQRRLAGRAGKEVFEVDPDGHPIPLGENRDRPPVAGENVVTTIDREIQYRVQLALAQAVRANHGRGGTVIVLDPHTGDILAMASEPSFDPTRIHDYRSDCPCLQNPAIVHVYEPGSVNKVITASAAIEEGLVSPGERFSVPDEITLDPSNCPECVFHDAHPHPTQRMTIADIIAQSSNVGTIKLAQRVGETGMSQYLARFGLGTRTDVGFPGESKGIVPPLSEWTAASMGTIPVGQGIAVTPLQMAAVYGAIANHGVWIQPRLVRGFVDGNGTFHPAPPAKTHRVVSVQTADEVTRILSWAVDAGTGTNAQIPGFWVAGKTGTAQIPKAHGGGYSNQYVASFIGFTPASDPQLVIAAIIDRPVTEYGALAAAPLFRQIGQWAIARMRIAPAPKPPVPPHMLSAG